MPEFHISGLDLAILFTYVIGTRIFFGWLSAKRVHSDDSESYFLAGRNVRWPILGLSFYVANMSGSTFVGLPGSGYHDGIAVYNYEWLPAVILIFFVLFFLPFYLRARVFTAPQFLEVRYDRRSRLAFSGFLLFANIFIDAAAALYAGGMIIEVLFPQIPLWVTVAATSLISGVYIYFGGLGAVVLNDALQAIMIFLGGCLIAVLAYLNIPSWQAVREAAPPGALHLIQPVDDGQLPWPGIFSGVLIVGIYFWCTNQFIIQRALGAKSLDEGRWGSLFAGFLKLPNLFILILPGVMATTLYPNLEKPDLVFPTLAFDLLPIGLRGLMLAALAAAIFSSLEAILNSASTLFTMDFVKTLRPQSSEETLVKVGRGATLAFMVLSAVWAPQIARWPTLWQYLQSILSYVTPPVVAVFLGGIFWKRVNRHGAFVTLAIGIPLGLAGWILNEILHFSDIQFLYACGIMFALCCVLLAVVSLATEPPDEETADHTWQWSLWQKETNELAGKPWYQNYRYLSLGLAAVTVAILAFWL